MKKILVILCVLFVGQSVFAGFVPVPMPKKDPWAFGVGFGTESNYDSVTMIELKTPTLFSFFRGTNKVALVATYETKEVSSIDKEITPVHLLFEITGNYFRDMVRPYVRLGGGSVLVDDTTIYPASNFFNVQFQLGLDILTGMSETGLGSSFFMQAMLNSPGIRNPPVGSPEIFDGTTMLVGIRMYF